MSVQTKYFDEDGKIVINRSQDIQRILDFNKERNIDGHNRKSDMRLAGSIPFVVIEMWMKECGAKLGSQELNEYIKKKLMSVSLASWLLTVTKWICLQVNIAVAALRSSDSQYSGHVSGTLLSKHRYRKSYRTS